MNPHIDKDYYIQELEKLDPKIRKILEDGDWPIPVKGDDEVVGATPRKSHATCECAEGKLMIGETDRDRKTGLNAHDCNYIKSRNTLLPAAEKIADSAAGSKRHRGTPAWSRVFLRTVDELVKGFRG